jgi:hypothetical protein
VLLNRGPDTSDVSVTALVSGAAREETLEGRGAPASLAVRLPPWANRMALDITFPDDLWEQVTDVGVLVRDASGRVLSDQPLEYPSGRRSMALDSVSRDGPVTVGLLPAFARPGSTGQWRARIRVTFLRADVTPLEVLGMGSVGHLRLPPHATLGLQFSPVPAEAEIPADYAPLVDVLATPARGPVARRRGLASGAGDSR